MAYELECDVAVIGGGISGLATAYWLHKQGIEVCVLEKSGDPGGSMESIAADGYMFDRGPNSGLETTPLIRQLVTELDLTDEFVYANPEGKKRYIVKNNKLHPIPMSLSGFLGTELFSASGKMRVLKEPFVGKSDDGYYQSVADFVSRRLGQEFLDYLINPFVSGVYAGSPERLSVRSAFPKLYALEEKYGSLTLGFVRGMKERRQRNEVSKQSAQMFSFRKGMQTLPKTLAAKLGTRVNFLCDIESIEKGKDRFLTVYNKAGDFKGRVLSRAVVTTIPAYALRKPVATLISDADTHLENIYHPPVLTAYLGYETRSINRPLDGFGFLIPEREQKSFLGGIWSSTLFPERAPRDVSTFTLFIGGVRNPAIVEQDANALLAQAQREFEVLMGISAEPVYKAMKLWPNAIPQYNLGYIEHERYFDSLEAAYPGFFISGNFRRGISVGDCIRNSDVVFRQVMDFLEK